MDNNKMYYTMYCSVRTSQRKSRNLEKVVLRDVDVMR